jgi:hypothetical protein
MSMMSRLRLFRWKAALGSTVALVAGALLVARVTPVGAQFVGKPPQVDLPPVETTPTSPQPLQVQALDATHFVVVTREPRLTTRVNGDGRWQQMLVTVVTHYTVQGGKLVPVEHVRVPFGYRAYGQQ